MKENAIVWIIISTIIVALGIGALVAYEAFEVILESYFFR